MNQYHSEVRVSEAFSQRCDVCGRPDVVDFHVNDNSWEQIVPFQFHNSVVCLTCFDYFVSAKDAAIPCIVLI